MRTVDLHVHSTCSDGTLTPTELIALAYKKRLAAIALTDHDTIDGIKEAIDAGKQHRIEVIPGIELSTSYQSKEIHIVGLFIDYTDDSFAKELVQMRNTRIERNRQVCRAFQQLNIPMTYEDIADIYENAVITRAHFADWLVHHHYVGDRNEAFDRYLGDGKPCYVPREKISPQHAIKLIRSVGGIPILAHPTLYHLGSEQMNILLKDLCDAGLMGIEGLYSTYTASDERYIAQLAADYHLLLSGGSDFHGANKPKLDLGTGYGKLCIPYDILSHLRAAKY